MQNVTGLQVSALRALKEELDRQYAAFKAKNLKLDMSRGKPAGNQLDLSNASLDRLDDFRTEDGTDVRNYGGLDGIAEARRLFGEVLGLNPANVMVGGNSSLNLMYDQMLRLVHFGTGGHQPWGKQPAMKFLCPSPGYDRHFMVCQDIGIEMIPVAMKDDGPDMDQVEALVAADPAIKGMWSIPLYSNPTGVSYSDEVVTRLGAMKTAAPDFRIFWDNAYGIHHVYGEQKLMDIFKACEAGGNPDRALFFFSTSKITFPGSGVALLAASEANLKEIRKHMGAQTIGPDKINQLRTVRFLKDAAGVKAHMAKHAGLLRPKFDIVLDTLDRELKGTGLASWTRPAGGYFVALDTLDGCAKATVALAKEAGVVMTGAGATFPYGKDPRDRNIRIAPTFPTCEELQVSMDLFTVCVKLAGVNKLLEGK